MEKCNFLKILQCHDFENLWGDFWHLSQPKKLDESDGGFFFKNHLLVPCDFPVEIFRSANWGSSKLEEGSRFPCLWSWAAHREGVWEDPWQGISHLERIIFPQALTRCQKSNREENEKYGIHVLNFKKRKEKRRDLFSGSRRERKSLQKNREICNNFSTVEKRRKILNIFSSFEMRKRNFANKSHDLR